MRLTALFLVGLCILSNAVAQDTAQPPASSNAVASQPVSQPASQAASQPAATPVSNIPQQSQQVSGSQPSGSPVMSGSVPIVTGIIATALPTATVGAQNNSVAALPTSGVYGNSVYPAAAVFVTPTASKSVSPLYRIDSRENVTFAWTYTNLLVRPESLTMAAVAPNGVTYTIGSMAGDVSSAVWQIKDVPAASPLMMGMYKVQLYDQRGVSATPQPGWLAPLTTLSIAFYSAESYQPVTGSGYCPTCFYNAGKRVSESLGPIMMALGVACITSSMIIYGLLY